MKTSRTCTKGWWRVWSRRRGCQRSGICPSNRRRRAPRTRAPCVRHRSMTWRYHQCRGSGCGRPLRCGSTAWRFLTGRKAVGCWEGDSLCGTQRCLSEKQKSCTAPTSRRSYNIIIISLTKIIISVIYLSLDWLIFQLDITMIQFNFKFVNTFWYERCARFRSYDAACTTCSYVCNSITEPILNQISSYNSDIMR